MIREKQVIFRRVILGIDGVLILLAYVLSYLIRPHLVKLPLFRFLAPFDTALETIGTFSEHLIFLLLIVLFWCLVLYLNGMYRPMRTRSVWKTLWILVKSAFFADLAFGMLVFMLKLSFINRRFFALFAMLSFGFILAEKVLIYIVMYSVRTQGRNQRHFLIVGTGPRAAGFIHRIKDHPEWGINIVGAIDDEPGRGVKSVDGVKIIGDLKDIPVIFRNQAIDEVVFVVPRLRLHYLENAIRDCEVEGVSVTIAVDLFDLKIAKSSQSEIDGIPLLTFKTTVHSEWELFFKRVMDIVVSGICILVFSPVLLIASVLVKLTSKGPILHKQERTGLNGRKFVMYKFRTMYVGAQKKLSQVDVYKEIYETKWKNTKRQLITPVGRLLRKFSLDELPQFFNVFRGHMSLVGPRPTLTNEVEQYEAWHRRRFSMRPGLTCLWQVNGRREIKFNEWMQMDLEYLDNWSLWLDFKILVKTIPAVLFGSGAY